ncbi:MAG: hypothetical protein ABI451_04900 [Dokdonella sp.]
MAEAHSDAHEMEVPHPTGTTLRTDALFAAVYARLKAIASRQRAHASGATLNTTALVHEWYLKLGSSKVLSVETPAQFSTTPRRQCVTSSSIARVDEKSAVGLT